MSAAIQNAILATYQRITIATPTLVAAASTGQGATGPLTYDLTAAGLTGYQDNDILFALIQTGNETPPNTPTGYTYLTSYGIGTAAAIGSVALHSAWKRVSGTEANPSFGDSGDHTFVKMFLVRGCRTSGAPVVNLNGAASNTSEPLGVAVNNTTIDKNYVVYAVAHGQDVGGVFVTSWTDSALTGGTTIITANGTTLGNGGGIGAYAGEKTTAGSLGTPTIDLQNLTQPGNFVTASFAFIPLGA